MASNESKHGDHAFAIGGFSPFTLGHQAVAREMQKNHHASVNLYTTKATTRPIPADKKVEYIKKAVAPSTHVGATVTPLHALSDMHSRGLRGEVTFYGGSDRKPIADRLRQYNGKEGPHGYYKFDAIHFKQVGGERKEGASGLAGVSGTAARASKSPEELKKFIPKELHKHATEIFNHIQDKTSQKKPIRERYLNEELFNLLDIVQTKDGQVGEIVYRGSNYVTIQLPNEQITKSWIYEIKQLNTFNIPNQIVKDLLSTKVQETPKVNYKLKLNEKKIPALLIPSKNLLEEMGEISFDGYTTKHYDICPSAYQHIKKLVERKDLNPKYVKQAVMALDKMFALEKLAEKEKSATSEQVHDFSMYASIAHDTLNLLGIPDSDIKYIQDHYIRYSKLIRHHDYSIGDEPSSHTVMSHQGEIDEWVDPTQDQGRFVQRGRASPGMFKKVTSADYEVRTSPDGRKYKVKKQIISKGHQKIDNKDQGQASAPPFAGLSGMYEQERKMKIRKENYETPISNQTHDTTKPGNRVGVLPFGEFIKTVDVVPVKRVPIEGDQDNRQINNAGKTTHVKTAQKMKQMGLD